MGKVYLIALLLVISLFSTVNYVQYLRVVKEKQQLSENVNQISNKLNVLLSEKKDLIGQISDKMPVLEDERKGLIKKMAQINSELIEAKKTIRQLQLSMAILKREKEIFSQEAKKLGDEKAHLEVRLHSLKELKKAIREIKKDMYLIRRQVQKRIDTVITTESNRGYLVRDGKSTFRRKTIRVIPIERAQ